MSDVRDSLACVARAGGSVELGGDEEAGRGGCGFEAAAGEVNGAGARNASKGRRKKKKKQKATDGGCCSLRGRIRAKDGLALALVLVLVLRCGFLLLLNKNSPAVAVSGRGSGMDSSNRAFTRKETPVGGVRLGLISQCRWTLLSCPSAQNRIVQVKTVVHTHTHIEGESLTGCV